MLGSGALQALAAAFRASVVAATVLAAAYVVPVPPVVLTAAYTVVVAAAVVVAVATVVEARNTQTSIARSFGRGLRAAFQWVLDFIP